MKSLESLHISVWSSPDLKAEDSILEKNKSLSVFSTGMGC